ncbi:hypothetical protein CJ030_MR1G015692 [Morella rubra]|uniref:PGG domain-containing protein n=1 Tax=Morella rubra TaxID=262757 RepID=A0A6A1WNQ4_9ROSI|nr:hypothetical protein CJ030_MR1G015692 [Morella rubra]
METEATPVCAIGFEVLIDKQNYMYWSARVKTYLIAHDLWDIVAKGREPQKQEDDEAVCRVWRRKNSMALHLIQISCGQAAYSKIQKESSAKKAWDALAKEYDTQNNTNPGKDNNIGRAPHLGHEHREPLHHAVRSGNWDKVKEFLDSRHNAVSEKITHKGETALHVAVISGHAQIVDKLVELMPEKSLEIVDNGGYTALHHAVTRGKYLHAESMLKKNMKLATLRNPKGNIPVVSAFCQGEIDTARFLYYRIPVEEIVREEDHNAATLLTHAIYTSNLDIAWDLLKRSPDLALALDKDGDSPLLALASMPNLFGNGNRLRFWKRWIYKCCINIQWDCASDIGVVLDMPQTEKGQKDELKTVRPVYDKIIASFHDHDMKVAARLRHLASVARNFLGIDELYMMKLNHKISNELLLRMCEHISTLNSQQKRKGRVYTALIRATKKGMFEFVSMMLKEDQTLVWTKDAKFRNLILLAILHRQAEIVSLIFELDQKGSLSCNLDDDNNSMLHMVGMSADSTMLNRIAGAALQMQKELQWFKEVEEIVHPTVKEAENSDSLTARELFTKNHKTLLKEGERWMKDTATSCTVVGALIVTIMFAVAFTVPGGNNQDTGLPILANNKFFKIFIICDTLSLFSSSTSVLMFLGILTSRYAEDDFLESLPRKMIIGLSTLFFSIVTMMMAFSFALYTLLPKQPWIFFPATCLASVPVTLFLLLQTPLLFDMYKSTYISSILDRKSVTLRCELTLPIRRQEHDSTKAQKQIEPIRDRANGVESYRLSVNDQDPQTGSFVAEAFMVQLVEIGGIASVLEPGPEGALTRRFARRAVVAVEEASRPSTSALEAPMEMGALAVPPPWMTQLFADFDSRVGATMKATLQPFERRMQSMEEQLKELRTAFDGECTVTMLRNKSVVAQMADVSEQLEEIKKTLDDFKMEADP